jgi:hypothetical protein
VPTVAAGPVSGATSPIIQGLSVWAEAAPGSTKAARADSVKLLSNLLTMIISS